MTDILIPADTRIPAQRKHPLVRGERLPMHAPRVVTDGGPWATHDYACPVCRSEKAVLDLNTQRFQPCDKCWAKGWTVAQKSTVIQEFLASVLVWLMLVVCGLGGAYALWEWAT